MYSDTMYSDTTSSDAPRGAALLSEVLAHPNRRLALNELIAYCRRLALRHVRRKTSPAQLKLFGVSARDLAVDSIAELFEQSEEGKLLRLRSHFAPLREAASSQETEQQLRRLVAGAVNDRLFQVYQEQDPSLARLIRNVKRAARRIESCKLKRAEGRLWVTSTERPEDLAQPLLPTPHLEEGLRRELRGGTNSTRAVRVLLSLLLKHRRFRNGYPVSSFAVVLRAATARLHLPFLEEHSTQPGGLSEEMETLIGWRVLQAITQTRAALFADYVESGKVSKTLYEAYFRTIRDVLIAEFVDLKEELPSLWMFLNAHLEEELTSSSYRQTHRNVFEYLLDLSRRKLVASLQEDLQE